MAAEGDLFSYFKNEGLTKEGNSSVYCIVKSEAGIKIFDATGNHAEKNMINWIDGLFKKGGFDTLTLNIYQNKAPCTDCANALIASAERHNGLELKIKAVGPYHNNVDALRRLMGTPNISLEAFEGPDWPVLHSLIEAANGRENQRIGWEYSREIAGRDRRTANIFANIRLPRN